MAGQLHAPAHLYNSSMASPNSLGYPPALHTESTTGSLAVNGRSDAIAPSTQSSQATTLPRSTGHADGKGPGKVNGGLGSSSGLNGEAGGSGSNGLNMLNTYSTPLRSGTLRKKNSASKRASLRRADSSRSALVWNTHQAADDNDKFVVLPEDHMRSAFYTPLPTNGNPTDVLANRFQAWRKVVKDLIVYYREIQASYEQRSKAIMKIYHVINNTMMPEGLLSEGEGGVADTARVLREFHKKAIAESNKAQEIEEDVIVQLGGLRSDLAQKIKEIRSLSGDFSNSIEKEMEGTRRAVTGLREAIDQVEKDPTASSGKGDPFLVRLAVERQLQKQIDEENYLHRAYLNLESSGRELESIVVGEIQKSYNAYAGILRREADDNYEVIENLRKGPLNMPRDHEWSLFVESDSRFVDPQTPLRNAEDIEYTGKHHPAAADIRAGVLERKSKYLKSYTPGWYVLSPTHLHEFRSADRISSQHPVMSLCLRDQRLGSHSQPGSSSHKFILKGRQAGHMHRGHSWVFRAESRETMLAWYNDIKNLTEKTGEERNTFVRRHARSISAASQTAVSVDSDGGLDNDVDEAPYSANASPIAQTAKRDNLKRPQPGGRFPSALRVERSLRAPPSPSSASSDYDKAAVESPGFSPGLGKQHIQQSPPNDGEYQACSPRESTSIGAAVEGNEERPVTAVNTMTPRNKILSGSSSQMPAGSTLSKGRPEADFELQPDGVVEPASREHADAPFSPMQQTHDAENISGPQGLLESPRNVNDQAGAQAL